MSFSSMLERHWEKRGKGRPRPSAEDSVQSSVMTPRGYRYTILKPMSSEGACGVIEPSVQVKSRLVKAQL